MSQFSPISVAFAGLRVIHREPKAVLSWVVIWLAVPVFAGIMLALFAPHTALPGGGGISGLIRQSGLAIALVVSIFASLWFMTTASVYRAVLRPDEHGWHLFKLGPDEARLAALAVFSMIVGVPLVGSTAYLIYLISQPVLLFAPGFPPWLVDAGAAATAALEIWIAVRVSLAPVYTFDTHRYHLISYWDLTQTYFWRLLFTYVLVFLQILVIIIVGAMLSSVFEFAFGHAMLQITLLVSGLLKLVEIVVVWIVFCACQAAAYQAIMLNPPPAFHPTPSRPRRVKPTLAGD